MQCYSIICAGYRECLLQIARHWKPMRTEFPRPWVEILTVALLASLVDQGCHSVLLLTYRLILGVESAEATSQPMPLFGTRICRTGHWFFLQPVLATLRLLIDPQGLLSQNYLIPNTLKGSR